MPFYLKNFSVFGSKSEKKLKKMKNFFVEIMKIGDIGVFF